MSCLLKLQFPAFYPISSSTCLAPLSGRPPFRFVYHILLLSSIGTVYIYCSLLIHKPPQKITNMEKSERLSNKKMWNLNCPEFWDKERSCFMALFLIQVIDCMLLYFFPLAHHWKDKSVMYIDPIQVDHLFFTCLYKDKTNQSNHFFTFVLSTDVCPSKFIARIDAKLCFPINPNEYIRL